jgi:hypothetical protein
VVEMYSGGTAGKNTRKTFKSFYCSSELMMIVGTTFLKCAGLMALRVQNVVKEILYLFRYVARYYIFNYYEVNL